MNPWGGFWVARMLRSCLACSTHLLTCSMKVKYASYNNNMMMMMDNGCYHCGEVEDVRCIVGFGGKGGTGKLARFVGGTRVHPPYGLSRGAAT